MNEAYPIVSVIIPMRNSEKFITETLTTILCERDVPIEVLVVDDKSDDSSLQRVTAIQDKRIHIIEGPGRGISACINAGLQKATGAIIMRCDADDLYPVNRIKEQVNWLECHPKFGAVCGGFATIDVNGRWVADMPCGPEFAEITAELSSGTTRTSLCTFAIRSSVVRDVGGFREYFEIGEDLDFQFRLSNVSRIGYLPKNWYSYRIHSSSVTHRQSSAKRAYFEELAKEFQRQRRDFGTDDLTKGVPLSPPIQEGSTSATAKQHIQGMLFGRAWREHHGRRRIRALMTGARALTINAKSIEAWKSFISLAIKRRRSDNSDI